MIRKYPTTKRVSEFKFDTDEREAAKAIGVATDTLKGMRVRGEIPKYVYTKFSYKLLRYCVPLLQDWQLAPDDADAHARACDRLQSTRASSPNFSPSSIEDKKQEPEDV